LIKQCKHIAFGIEAAKTEFLYVGAPAVTEGLY